MKLDLWCRRWELSFCWPCFLRNSRYNTIVAPVPLELNNFELSVTHSPHSDTVSGELWELPKLMILPLLNIRFQIFVWEKGTWHFIYPAVTYLIIYFLLSLSQGDRPCQGRPTKTMVQVNETWDDYCVGRHAWRQSTVLHDKLLYVWRCSTVGSNIVWKCWSKQAHGEPRRIHHTVLPQHYCKTSAHLMKNWYESRVLFKSPYTLNTDKAKLIFKKSHAVQYHS